ncbi:hypothetical protein EI94DRAFT_1703498 [Lactarius quietus]|nr:hypothetical protein EI94DRAFT_1703498 [Lactarius quietus]
MYLRKPSHGSGMNMGKMVVPQEPMMDALVPFVKQPETEKIMAKMACLIPETMSRWPEMKARTMVRIGNPPADGRDKTVPGVHAVNTPKTSSRFLTLNSPSEIVGEEQTDKGGRWRCVRREDITSPPSIGCRKVVGGRRGFRLRRREDPWECPISPLALRERASEFAMTRFAVTIPGCISDDLARSRQSSHQRKDHRCTAVVPGHRHTIKRTALEMVIPLLPRMSEHSLTPAEPSELERTSQGAQVVSNFASGDFTREKDASNITSSFFTPASWTGCLTFRVGDYWTRKYTSRKAQYCRRVQNTQLRGHRSPQDVCYTTQRKGQWPDLFVVASDPLLMRQSKARSGDQLTTEFAARGQDSPTTSNALSTDTNPNPLRRSSSILFGTVKRTLRVAQLDTNLREGGAGGSMTAGCGESYERQRTTVTLRYEDLLSAWPHLREFTRQIRFRAWEAFDAG